MGVATAALVLNEELDVRLTDAAPALCEASKTWTRPEKTQTRTQWEFISKVAREVVRHLDVDADTAAQVMRDRFGSSGIETLWSVALDEPVD